MLVIGLTGGIASGKSAATEHFHTLGAAVLSADVLAREIVRVGSDGLSALTDAFGDSILLPNGELDRQALRTIIFASDEARQRVDDLLHPRIKVLSEKRIAEAKQNNVDYLIYEVPLLVETQQVDRFDRIVVVDIPTPLQIERLIKRDESFGKTTNEEQAQAIIDAQASREDRLAIADDVVDNSGSLDQLLSQVEALHQRYTKLANS